MQVLLFTLNESRPDKWSSDRSSNRGARRLSLLDNFLYLSQGIVPTLVASVTNVDRLTCLNERDVQDFPFHPLEVLTDDLTDCVSVFVYKRLSLNVRVDDVLFVLRKKSKEKKTKKKDDQEERMRKRMTTRRTQYNTVFNGHYDAKFRSGGRDN